uniref:hypothetical protein n=1 Tax=Paractinoplanes polyasparticus TaxID=2856853 RepID=UPI001C853054|nr:hypothetical protein [Actinoplanes polyasparticus]
MTDDLLKRADPFLNVCGSCDIGMGSCTCPTGDYRPVMLELYREVERLRAVAWQLHNAMTDQHEQEGHLMNDDCESCRKAFDEMDSQYCCDDWKRRQKAYVDALGLVIGEKP